MKSGPPKKKDEKEMKLTRNKWLHGAGRQLMKNPVLVAVVALGLLGMALLEIAGAQSFSTTTVQGTMYLANGQAASGTLRVSWPAFTTANGQAVAAGSSTVTIAADGFVSMNLAPNVGATPAGLFYTAIFYLSDGTTNTQYRRRDPAKLLGVFDGFVYQSAVEFVRNAVSMVGQMESGGCG
jgi:hypothetical protein